MIEFYEMHDLVAIGDIVSDAFIRISSESGAGTSGSFGDKDYKICLPFAEKIPYESVEVVPAVGNSPNAAVSAARLGLKAALVSNLGEDQNGIECLKRLHEEGVDTGFVISHYGKNSNYHYVLWYGDDRTILVKHEEYDYNLPDVGETKWLYLSSLGSSTLEYHKEISQYLSEHPGVSLAFQPGTFQMKLGRETLKDIYTRAKILFCNVEETERILGIETLGIQELLKRMKEIGPEIVVITDGANGAYAYDGTEMLFQTPYPDPKPPLERTGAGDAFASTVVSALALDKDLKTALSWGAVNSMSVVQEVGAQKGLLSQSEIEKLLQAAPEEFKVKTL